MSRLIWAVANIIVFTYGIELLHDSDDPILSALVLFSLLLLCEILPVMIMLDYSYIQIISFEHNAFDNANDTASRAGDSVSCEEQHSMNTRGMNWLDFSESLFSSAILEEDDESASEPLIIEE